MPDLSTAAGGWDTWPEPVAAPEQWSPAEGPGAASELWNSPSPLDAPATGQGWPPMPGDAAPEAAPESDRIQPAEPPPAMEWPESVTARTPGEVLPEPPVPPAAHHHPAPLPPVWPAPPEPPPVGVPGALAETAAPPEPPPAPASGAPARAAIEPTGSRLPTGGITAPGLAAPEETAPAWHRAPSTQPSRFPTLAELPGWRLDGPSRRREPTSWVASRTEADIAQRFRGAPPAGTLPTGDGDGSSADEPPRSAPRIPSEPGVTRGSGPETMAAGGESRSERPPQAPRTPTPAAAAEPIAASRPVLPLLPGGQAAPVSTRPWTMASAMLPLAPLAPPATHPGGAALPEAMGPVLSRNRSTGMNLPFGAVVTALVVVLALIIVLIVLGFHH